MQHLYVCCDAAENPAFFRVQLNRARLFSRPTPLICLVETAILTGFFGNSTRQINGVGLLVDGLHEQRYVFIVVLVVGYLGAAAIELHDCVGAIVKRAYAS
jgi:hypothetical protein